MNEAQVLTLKTPRRKRIIRELDAFIDEWRSWELEVLQIGDHPYNRMTQSSVFTDGEENMKRHTILQERTRAFLNKNTVGHGFIFGQQGENVDRTDLRLRTRVGHRIHDLNILRARIEYAEVPKRMGQTKKMLFDFTSKLLGLVPDFLAKYLRSWS